MAKINLAQESSTPSNPSAGANRLYFKGDDKLYKLNSAGSEEEIGAGGGASDYISGLRLTWVSATALTVGTGAACLSDGTLIEVGTAIAKSSLSLSNSTWYHIYLYLNSGSPDIEIVTTAPASPYRGTAKAKTADTSRRYIGSIRTDGSGNLPRIVTSHGNRYVYADGGVAGRTPVDSQTSASAWTSFSLANFVPTTAIQAYLLVKFIGTASGDDGVVGISPIDLGAGVAANASPQYYRSRATTTTQNIFFGTTWNVLEDSQAYFYRTLLVSGTVKMSVEVHGYEVSR